jgi:4-hydroxybenzoyl-CoA thioesterase
MEYKVKVHWGDTDPAGIVYYPNFYKWMDEATHELFSAIGHPTEELFNANIAFPLLETHCQFKRPVFYNTELVVKTEIEFIKEKVFKLVHQFYCDGQMTGEGYEVRAWSSTAGERLKAVPIPQEIKDKLLFKEGAK